MRELKFQMRKTGHRINILTLCGVSLVVLTTNLMLLRWLVFKSWWVILVFYMWKPRCVVNRKRLFTPEMVGEIETWIAFSMSLMSLYTHFEVQIKLFFNFHVPAIASVPLCLYLYLHCCYIQIFENEPIEANTKYLKIISLDLLTYLIRVLWLKHRLSQRKNICNRIK